MTGNNSAKLLSTWIGVFYALILWTLMFGFELGNFWAMMTFATSTLAVWSFFNDRSLFKDQWNIGKSVLWGVFAAAVLYGVFYLGDILSSWLPFQNREVVSIYSTKSALSHRVIGLLLVTVIGPGEEIFWRGFVQKQLGLKYGPLASMFLTASVYAIVHIGSLNFVLIMAALICGLFWGWLYYYSKSILPGILSHALWDVLIFIIFPLR